MPDSSNFGNSPYNDPSFAAKKVAEFQGDPTPTNAFQLDPSKDALSQLGDLASTNPEYLETYLQLLAERENTTNAQAWYEKMSGSQYQRAMEDLKKAGLNPWLALQHLNGAGSGSVSPAGTWSTSPYANKMSREQNKINQANATSKGVQALASIAGIVVGALIALI